jgi:hypothetical protein
MQQERRLKGRGGGAVTRQCKCPCRMKLSATVSLSAVCAHLSCDHASQRRMPSVVHAYTGAHLQYVHVHTCTLHTGTCTRALAYVLVHVRPEHVLHIRECILHTPPVRRTLVDLRTSKHRRRRKATHDPSSSATVTRVSNLYPSEPGAKPRLENTMPSIRITVEVIR